MSYSITPFSCLIQRRGIFKTTTRTTADCCRLLFGLPRGKRRVMQSRAIAQPQHCQIFHAPQAGLCHRKSSGLPRAFAEVFFCVCSGCLRWSNKEKAKFCMIPPLSHCVAVYYVLFMFNASNLSKWRRKAHIRGYPFHLKMN